MRGVRGHRGGFLRRRRDGDRRGLSAEPPQIRHFALARACPRRDGLVALHPPRRAARRTVASDLAVPAALYPHPAPQRVRAAPLPRGAPEQSLAHLLLPRPPLAPHRSPAPPPAALWLCSESATASRSQAARGGRDACEPSASGGGETQADLARRERNWAQRLKSKERKAAKVANLPAEERYVPSSFKTDQLIFVKPATAPTPAVHRGPQPPQLSPHHSSS